MKILLTGAAGLLGSELTEKLTTAASTLHLEQLIRQRRTPTPGYVAADLSHPEGVAQLAAMEWDVIIHTAAAKDPDYCEQHPEEATALNATGTRLLAAEAARRHAKMLYIGTDYVFAGTHPPYAENATPDPVNLYGRTKLAGEQAVLQAAADNCSLRVPVLYGQAAGLRHAALLYGAWRAVVDPREKAIDDGAIRYPTCTEDVAAAIILLLTRNGRGIFHCTGHDRTTKYRIAVAVAELMGRSHAHLHPQMEPAPGIAPRPVDSHLASSRLEQLGFAVGRSFADRLASYRDLFPAAAESL
ncbi:MAG: SDR family oxidoreductase [Victivallales bacterium]|nr:SDR family oxidoreductase [Victivallales bacterium]